MSTKTNFSINPPLSVLKNERTTSRYAATKTTANTMIKMDMMTVEAVFSSDPRPAPGKIPNTSAGIALTADPSAAAAAINIAPREQEGEEHDDRAAGYEDQAADDLGWSRVVGVVLHVFRAGSIAVGDVVLESVFVVTLLVFMRRVPGLDAVGACRGVAVDDCSEVQ